MLPVKIWAVQKEAPILNLTARFALKLQMSVRACNLRKSVIIKGDRDMILTRKHSSRVRTARLQTICVSVIDHQMLLPGEGEGGEQVNKFEQVSNVVHQMSVLGGPRSDVIRDRALGGPRSDVGGRVSCTQ